MANNKGETIAGLATHSDDTEYLMWLLKQDEVDPYLDQAYQQVLKSVKIH